MEEITAPGDFTLDKCPHGHGLWFDTDELQQLLTVAHADRAVAYLNDIFGKSLNT
jgi:Zn-finger nucleic acid-binding protein